MKTSCKPKPSSEASKRKKAKAPPAAKSTADQGLTSAMREVLRSCPAMNEARAIWEDMTKLVNRLEAWIDTFGAPDDPGLVVIRHAGLTPPPGLIEYGTDLFAIRRDFIGTAWSLAMFESAVEGSLLPPRQSTEEPTAA